MNIGAIPGYYWDDTHKRYFRILGDHQVPPGAKYAHSSVEVEKRIAKKRKGEQSARARREAETIQAAPILKSAVLGGVGLRREHGVSTVRPQTLLAAEETLVSQLQPWSIKAMEDFGEANCRLLDAYHIPTQDCVVTAIQHRNLGATCVCAAPRMHDFTAPRTLPTQQLHAFNGPVACISSGYYESKRDVMPAIVACATEFQLGNLYICFGLFGDAEIPDETITIGALHETIADCAMHPSDLKVAVIGPEALHVVDLEQAHIQLRKTLATDPENAQCAPCVNWLTENTLVYTESCHSPPAASHIQLYDCRAQAGSTRFTVPRRLTSLLTHTLAGPFANGSSHDILATTNHHILLFDTRMPRLAHDPIHPESIPVLTIPHMHGGPRAHTAAKSHLFAAVDADNLVQVYSLRSGSKIAALTPPESPTNMPRANVLLSKLQWYDDDFRGLTLQAVNAVEIVRWNWGGAPKSYEV